MDFLWSPWRYQYIQAQPGDTGCVLCRLADDQGPEADAARYVLHRGRHNFVVLNLYPYTSGHLMIAPYAHLSLIGEADKPTTDEMMDLAKQAQRALAAVYRPGGYNLGMNLGAAAGAGVAKHFHLHLLPRWVGDTNFLTTVGETRSLPEDLTETYRKLKTHF
jgi:ATP adenylyltransferase